MDCRIGAVVHWRMAALCRRRHSFLMGSTCKSIEPIHCGPLGEFATDFGRRIGLAGEAWLQEGGFAFGWISPPRGRHRVSAMFRNERLNETTGPFLFLGLKKRRVVETLAMTRGLQYRPV